MKRIIQSRVRLEVESISLRESVLRTRIRLEVESISLRRSVLRTTRTWCQIVSLWESVLCSRLTSRSRKARASRSRKARAKSSELHKESTRSILRSLHRCMLAEAIRTLSRSSLDFLTSLTHLLNLLQSNYIDIESMRSQCEMKDLRYLWDINDVVEWVTARVVNVSSCHSRLHRNAQAKSTCFTVYLSVNSRYLLSYRCNISREVHSKHRSSEDIDAFVIQIDSVLRRILSHYRRSIRLFLHSSRRCMI